MEDNIRKNKEAEVKVDKKLLKAIAANADALNTIGGGMATTKMEIMQLEDGYFLKMNIPTVSVEAYNIEINRDQLMIFTTLPEQRDSELGEGVVSPFFQSFPISSAVDVDGIEAVFENGELQVFAPFREDYKSNTTKRIDIRQL
ncbi:MAG TPA: hypothetical protein DCS93_00020 [Microscillaceae bacterium]|nr:hypothetical protein [Microscillaceae bacterium]